MTDAEFAALSAEYDAAFADWEGSEDAALWETTIGDGLDDEDNWVETTGTPGPKFQWQERGPLCGA